jgi:hypothetical protein
MRCGGEGGEESTGRKTRVYLVSVLKVLVIQLSALEQQGERWKEKKGNKRLFGWEGEQSLIYRSSLARSSPPRG